MAWRRIDWKLAQVSFNFSCMLLPQFLMQLLTHKSPISMGLQEVLHVVSEVCVEVKSAVRVFWINFVGLSHVRVELVQHACIIGQVAGVAEATRVMHRNSKRGASRFVPHREQRLVFRKIGPIMFQITISLCNSGSEAIRAAEHHFRANELPIKACKRFASDEVIVWTWARTIA